MSDTTARTAPAVLIIAEDTRDARRHQDLLEARGYTVLGIVDDIVSCLQAAAYRQPDLALVDSEPRSGISAITIAGELRDLYGTRLVFVTSQPLRVVWAFGDIHTVSIVAKPFGDTTLLEAVDAALAEPVAPPRVLKSA